MATVAFLVDGEFPEFGVGTTVVDQLTRIGVTSLTVFRDDRTVCVVLDGWAFEPSAAANAAQALGAARLQTLRPIMQTALAAVDKEV